MKKFLLILLSLSLIFITGCGNDEAENTNENENTNIPNVVTQNSNEGVIKRQEVEGIIFDNVILKMNNNMSHFNVDVTNNNSTDVEIKYIKVTAYDNEDKELFTFNSYIGDVIASNQSLTLSSNIEGDLANVYSVSYEIIK